MRAVLIAGIVATVAGGARSQAPDIVARASAPLAEPLVDLALIDEERLLALSPDAVSLYRWGSDGLTLDSRRLLPGPGLPVRAAGGLLTAVDADGAFWALTSRAAEAALFRIDGRHLVELSRAEALPWPGCREGLRMRPGTNLIDGRIASLGMGPFLTLEPGFGVDSAARLRTSAEGAIQGSLRVGPTLALLGPLLAASTPEAPGPADAILLLAAGPDGWTILRSHPIEGAVRALAGRVDGDRGRLVAAVETPDGGTYRLVIFDLAWAGT